MLALHSAQKTSSCTPNVLPCRIHYDGPVETEERHWHPVKDEREDKLTAYYRGRKLRGRLVQVPEGYQGVVALPTDRVIPATSKNDTPEDALTEEPVKALETQATFDDFVVWGHEHLPAADEAFVKGVEEWIQLAEAMHGDSQSQEKTTQ
ncbi:hypothetical protein UA08_03576 [Talaromyces atroroseus]|uniref:Uncharacterized protein n=1 Tax=Talaromyces atroroseus TaxID=1441469 RepID=A0A225AJ98_TALAT|nr:hypothetical protein UA08_03576 [Talaromyces atroroseus]OKL60930.1 hypothetical protein UA08_03576 [Talaromyces atroroseus]